MSNLQRKTLAYYGIQNYLSNRYNISSRQTISKIMKEFLEYKKLPFIKHKKNYKGLFTADICNAETIQQDFEEFKIFLNLRKLK